jgi:hypothetical protein
VKLPREKRVAAKINQRRAGDIPCRLILKDKSLGALFFSFTQKRGIRAEKPTNPARRKMDLNL